MLIIPARYQVHDDNNSAMSLPFPAGGKKLAGVV